MHYKNKKTISFTLLWMGIPTFIFTLICLTVYSISLVNYFHVVAALVAIVSLFNFSRSIDLKKDQYTASIISEVYKKDMSKALSTLGGLFKQHTETLKQKNITDLEEHLSQNRDVELSLIRILNYLESIAILSKSSLINERLAERHLKNLVIKIYNHLYFYIEYKQKMTPRTWCEYVKLSQKWIELEKKP